MSLLRRLSAVLLLTAANLAQAGFSIIGTRVIYHEASGEASVHLLRSPGEQQPVLLQAWLDDGSPSALAGTQPLAFVLTPTVSRVEADGAQVIRIFRVGDNLPTDRETLYFFNALEVPPENDASQNTGQNSLQFAMQARMKFFYRPTGLSPAPAQAPEHLRFTVLPTTAHTTHPQTSLSLHIHNPTPYHITLPRLALYAASAASEDPALAQMSERAIAPMVAPFASLTVTLDVLAPGLRTALPKGQTTGNIKGPMTVRYSFINDQGGLSARQGTLGDAD